MSERAAPVTRFARTPSGSSIAYQVIGDSEVSIVSVPPWPRTSRWRGSGRRFGECSRARIAVDAESNELVRVRMERVHRCASWRSRMSPHAGTPEQSSSTESVGVVAVRGFTLLGIDAGTTASLLLGFTRRLLLENPLSLLRW